MMYHISMRSTSYNTGSTQLRRAAGIMLAVLCLCCMLSPLSALSFRARSESPSSSLQAHHAMMSELHEREAKNQVYENIMNTWNVQQQQRREDDETLSSEESPVFLEVDSDIPDFDDEPRALLQYDEEELALDTQFKVQPEVTQLLNAPDEDTELAQLESSMDAEQHTKRTHASMLEVGSDAESHTDTDADTETDSQAEANAEADAEVDAAADAEVEEARVEEKSAIRDAQRLAESEIDFLARDALKDAHSAAGVPFTPAPAAVANTPAPAPVMMEVSSQAQFTPDDTNVHKTVIASLRAGRLRAKRLENRHLIDAAVGNSEEKEDPQKFGIFDEREAIEAKKEYDSITIQGMNAQRMHAVGSLRPVGQPNLPFCGTYPFCKDAPAPPALNPLPPAPTEAVATAEKAISDPLINLPRKVTDLQRDPARFQQVFENIYDSNSHNEMLRNHMGSRPTS